MVKLGLLSVCLAMILWMSFGELHRSLTLKSLPLGSTLQRTVEKSTSLPNTSFTEHPSTEKTSLNDEASIKQFKQIVYELWSSDDESELRKRSTDIQMLLYSENRIEGPTLPSTELLYLTQSLDRLLFQESSPDNNSSAFRYGYQMTRDDKHGVHLELSQPGVSISTELQTDPEAGLEVQSLQIEVDLPK